MTPSPEAAAWQQRADAWAQQSEPEQSQAVEPVSRWSEVAETGRPTFPADGVGWRTETSEWRATGARWRQTTEWRSTTGTHGWRSTTEAWRTGGNRDYVPPVETPAAQPAISSTAWSSSGAADEPQRDTTQRDPTHRDPTHRDTTHRWQQPAETGPADESRPSRQTGESRTSWTPGESARPGWQQFTEPPTQSWQQPAAPIREPAPRPPAESPPSWQQLVEPTPRAPETPSWNSTPSWNASVPGSTPTRRRDAIEGSATWTDTSATQEPPRPDAHSFDSTASRPRAETPPETPSWQRGETPSWQTPRDDGRHLVREDDRAAWRRDAEVGEGSRQIGRRRAPESGSRPSGGTGWAIREDSDNWAGHADTGSIQLFPDPAAPETPAWGARSEAPSRFADSTGRRAAPAYDENTGRRGDAGRRALPTAPYAEAPGPRPLDYGSTRPSQHDDAVGRGNPPDPSAASYGAPAAPSRPARDRYSEDVDGAPSTPYSAGALGPGPTRHAADRGYPTSPPTSGYAPERQAPDRYAAENRAAENRAPETRVPGARGTAGPPRYSDETSYPEAPAPSRRAIEGRAARDDDEADGRRRHPDPDPSPPRRGRARPRYNDTSSDWREHTSSWEAEPDTSSWTRDPDTGQWSRSEDDPRVQAWREATARREAKEGRPAQRRALPAGSGDSRQRDDDSRRRDDDFDRRDDDDDWRDPPPRGGGPTGGRPRGSASTSAIPRGTAGVPRGRVAPAGGVSRASGAPTSGMANPRSGEPGNAPRSSPPSRDFPAAARTSVSRYDDDQDQDTDDATRPDPYGPRQNPYGPRPDPYAEPEPTHGAPPGGTYGAPGEDSHRDDRPNGRRRAGEDPPAGRRRAEPEPEAGHPAPPVPPDVWRRDPDARSAGRLDLDEDVDRRWPPRGGARPSDDVPERHEPGDWQRAEREEATRGSATYREAGATDWRRDLADQSDPDDGADQRYGTSGFVPFRSSGSAAVQGSSNLSMTSTSLLVPRRDPSPSDSAVRPQRAANGFQAAGGSYERRPVSGGLGSGRRSNLLDPDDEEDDQSSSGPLAAVGYTAGWYGVPVVLFVFYMLVNSDSQSHALDTVAKAAPQFGISLVLSILVAIGIRRASSSWKAVSVGLAAAVVGGGLATVLSSAITGNSLS